MIHTVPMIELVLFAELFTMIGRDDDQALVVPGLAREPLEQPADDVVHVRHGSVVRRVHLRHF